MTSARSSLRTAEEQGKAYLSKLGANDIKAARALSAEAIQKETKGMGSFRLVADGETIAGNQYALFEAGKFRSVSEVLRQANKPIIRQCSRFF